MNYSLETHRNKYDLSVVETLQFPFLSPYARRHLELSNSTKGSSIQRWGHRTIAFLECIPGLGAIVSLIERIVHFVCKRLLVNSTIWGKQKTNVKITPAKSPDFGKLFTQLPSVLVSSACEFLNYRELTELAESLPENNRDAVWRGLAQHLKVPIPSGVKAKEVIDAVILTEFSKHVLEMEDLVKEISQLSLLEKANKCREWLNSPEAAKVENLDFGPNYGQKPRNLWAIPPEIKFFTGLTRLCARNNQLTLLPAEIGSLKKLTNLDLMGNKLRELPCEIGSLLKLRFLELSRNQLSVLPEQLYRLVNLEYVTLDQNQLKKISPAIGNLRKLIGLYLNDNSLETIPDELGNLINLDYIYLSDNKIKHVPQSLCKLRSTFPACCIYLLNNPIESIPEELQRRQTTYLGTI